ncbi:deoxyribose-phosphate aldolase [bacterium]|nr:deoxyribose-phosphate aldolase [bacterium]
MQNINEYIEHTLLKPDATSEQIEKLVKEALEYNFFGVCVNPFYVKKVSELLSTSKTKIVTVVNFPLASNTIETTLFQTEMALKDGADEIDTVLNIPAFKNNDTKKVLEDIKRTKEVCHNHNLKVILETDLLTKDEIILACKICADGGANFVKTSTGFVKNGVGAKGEDVEIMHKIVAPYGMKVKASGGIKTYAQAQKLIELGASRLGTSSGVEIIKGER